MVILILEIVKCKEVGLILQSTLGRMENDTNLDPVICIDL